MNLMQARDMAGRLTYWAEPMNCAAFTLPTSYCHTGVALSKNPKAICSQCYAKIGSRYIEASAAAAQQKRIDAITNLPAGQWIDALVYMLQHQPFQRMFWHDSGDLQGEEHFERICEVARRTPDIQHRISTKEWQYVNTTSIPENMILRYSALAINHRGPDEFGLTCGVYEKSRVHEAKADAVCYDDMRPHWDKSKQFVVDILRWER